MTGEAFLTAVFAAALTFGFTFATEAFLTAFFGADFLIADLALVFGVLLFLGFELFFTAIALTSFQDMIACVRPA